LLIIGIANRIGAVNVVLSDLSRLF
jgi:hypothetical protein